MKAVALLSGGKDSTLAAYLASKDYDVKHALVVVPSDEESMMFHVPNAYLGELVAKAMGLRPVRVSSGRGDEGDMRALEDALASLDVDALISGAIASRYQKERLDALCERLGIEHVHPLWGIDPFEELELLVEEGFDVMVTAVAAEGMGEEWLGRRLDRGFIEDVRVLHETYGIHPAGEGGEYETLVLDGPPFRARLEIVKARKEWDGVSGRLVIEEVRLVDKGGR